MNLKQTTILALATTLVAATLVTAGSVAARDEPLVCSVLPDSICAAAENERLDQSGLWAILILALNIMTVGVAIVAVGAVGFAGFLYTTAQGDAAQVKKAIEMIRNTALGIVVYALLFAGVNFLVPGGVFGTRIDDGGGSSTPAPPPCGPGIRECPE